MFGRKQLLIAAVGAIAFLGWGAPNHARASCGDYDMPNGQGHGQTSTQQTQPSPSNSQEQTPVKPRPGKPCQGPQCEHHQNLPPAPPAPPAPSSQKLFVGCLDLVQLDDLISRFFLEETRGRLSAGATLDIFHPPRSI